jgi:hypothetical protein
MKQRLLVLAAVVALAALIGVGFAASRGQEEPLRAAPDLTLEEVYVAGPDGAALKCAGKLVKLRRSEIGGSVPVLTPEQAVEQMKGRGGFPEPRATMFVCVKDKLGRETGAVTTRVVADKE